MIGRQSLLYEASHEGWSADWLTRVPLLDIVVVDFGR